MNNPLKPLVLNIERAVLLAALQLGQLPANGNGQIDRRRLLELVKSNLARN